jgi:hypothetical protein
VIRRLLTGAAGILLASGAAIVAGGGFTLAAGRILIRVHTPWRLVVAGAAAAAAAFVFGGPDAVGRDLERTWAARRAWAPWVAGSAAAATLLAGLLLGTWTAGSADSYGYVSQALLWLGGSTVQARPLAAHVPWPAADWSFSPLGYRPAATPGAIVPTYPPGLPLLMAGAAAVAGPGGVFWIVPLLGAAAVWLTFLFARHLADASAGAVAAVLLAASPVFLFQLVQPMSDVPVTAWWLATLLGVAAGRPGLAGACAAAAVLTRPNLAPLAGWALAGVILRGGVPARRQARLRDAVSFIAPVAAALAFLGVLYAHWYGHPLATGYGAASDLFSAANIPVNLRHYLGWLVESQTPFVLLGLAAPILAWLDLAPATAAAAVTPDAGAAGTAAGFKERRDLAWFSLVFAGLVLASYLPYSPFAEWWYLRFLLPALPVVLVLASAVALRVVALMPAAARVPALVLGVALLAGHYVGMANGRDAFNLARFESRYRTAGEFASRALPSTAILLSVQESGPLRFYGGRQTLRFDHLGPRDLDAVVTYLQQAGYQPYFALEAWEEAQFRDRFARSSELGQLDWPPAAEVGSPVKVRFYDPRDRPRFLAGERVSTIRGASPPVPSGPVR